MDKEWEFWAVALGPVCFLTAGFIGAVATLYVYFKNRPWLKEKKRLGDAISAGLFLLFLVDLLCSPLSKLFF